MHYYFLGLEDGLFYLQREPSFDSTAEHNEVRLSLLTESGTELYSAVFLWVVDRCCGKNQTDVHCLSLRLDWKHLSIFCQPPVLPFHVAWLIGHWFGCHDTVLWSRLTREQSVQKNRSVLFCVSCVSQTQQEIVMPRKAATVQWSHICAASCFFPQNLTNKVA